MKIVDITQEIRSTSRAEGRPYVRFLLTREDGRQLQFEIAAGAINSAAKWNNSVAAADALAKDAGFKIPWVEIRERFQRLAEGVE